MDPNQPTTPVLESPTDNAHSDGVVSEVDMIVNDTVESDGQKSQIFNFESAIRMRKHCDKNARHIIDNLLVAICSDNQINFEKNPDSQLSDEEWESAKKRISLLEELKSLENENREYFRDTSKYGTMFPFLSSAVRYSAQIYGHAGSEIRSDHDYNLQELVYYNGWTMKVCRSIRKISRYYKYMENFYKHKREEHLKTLPLRTPQSVSAPSSNSSSKVSTSPSSSSNPAPASEPRTYLCRSINSVANNFREIKQIIQTTNQPKSSLSPNISDQQSLEPSTVSENQETTLKRKRGYEKWTDEEYDELISMVNEDCTIKEISSRLGRNLASVRTKLWQIGRDTDGPSRRVKARRQSSEASTSSQSTPGSPKLIRRTGTAWTPREEAVLRNLTEQGLSVKEIAWRLSRSRRSILAKRSKMGIYEKTDIRYGMSEDEMKDARDIIEIDQDEDSGTETESDADLCSDFHLSDEEIFASQSKFHDELIDCVAPYVGETTANPRINEIDGQNKDLSPMDTVATS